MSNIPSREEVERELALPYPEPYNSFALANRILKALWEGMQEEHKHTTRTYKDILLAEAMYAASALYEEKP